MQALSVPSSESEITHEWLETALAHSPVKMTGPLELARIGEDYGFASTIVRCHWQAANPPNSAVIKFWDTESKAGVQEVHFFQTLVQTIGTRVPHCYHAAANLDTQSAVLVLEDLQDAVQGDCLKPLDLERSENVAQSLASLHATWLDHPKLSDLSWLTDMSQWTPKNEWVQSRRSLFLERFGEPTEELAKALLHNLEHIPRIINERLTNAPVTLLHGDFHLDNLLFERRTKPVLLDWSRPVKGPVAQNLIELLCAMTPLENFDCVLATYVTAFNEQAEKPLAKEALENQLSGAFLRKFTLSTLGMAASKMPPPRGPRLLQIGLEQASSAADFFYKRNPELFAFL